MARPVVPAGYEMQRERGAVVVALPSVMGDVRAAISAAGTLYADAAVRPEAFAFQGRGNAWYMRFDAGDCVVRHYRRGGAVALILTDSYARVGQPRPLRELWASVTARAKGVATPEVIATVVYPRTFMYRGDIATRFISRSTHLAELTIAPQRRDASLRLAAWRAAGRLLRSAFDAGVHHADLNLGNVLICTDDRDDVRAMLLDLDRAVVTDEPVTARRRRAMLDRFHRSRRKFESRAEYRTPADELAAFEAAMRGDA